MGHHQPDVVADDAGLPLSFGSPVLAPLWPRLMARSPDVELIHRMLDIDGESWDLAIRISRTAPPQREGPVMVDFLVEALEPMAA